ncbi:primosomal protein N' [Steroidobacter denitrificans]|uniref:Replication restart protein PriA n=1 Tax=Steroidobacter denitrificans TaxID=465721 RepID=A0A127F5A1_STEDE|nr:primosomal protein N' [Steroidobacter denitrificans]AMN45624.1 primosomal protein N' [Steroidobacter denitrificans]
MILGVAIDTPLRRIFDYRVSAGQPSPPHGGRVWVPFGRRRVVGIVIEYREHTEVPAGKLRDIHACIDTEPVFDPQLLKLLLWSAEYYRHPVGEVLAAALPAALRAGAPLREELRVWRLTEAGRRQAMTQLSARATRLRSIVEYLAHRDAAPASDILQAAGASMEALHRLAARGFVEWQQPVAETASSGTVHPGPSLNDAQQAAVEHIAACLGGFSALLLQGVTGSGKTEVYMQAIAAVLARTGQALVLVPEIALTPQLVSRFRERFDLPMAVLHSGLSDGERLAAWRQAQLGQVHIVIGTRSAVFAPLPRLGLIVMDEEHDPSFKQQDGFRYSARDLAILRAQRLDIPIVLGSATPSLESLLHARRQPETLLRLPRRAAGAKPPRLSLVDLRNQPQTQGLATATVQAIDRHLRDGGQVMLFLNRRGYAPVMFCPGCGWTAQCRRCDAHLTVHGRGTQLACHHCGNRQVVAELCPLCSTMLKPVGQGTERIEETLGLMFPGVALARIDRDSIRRKGELEAVLTRINDNEVRLLVGTQMLTKGHDFPNVTLVVVLNADQGLFSTDYRASERLAQTIVQVAGRAGRAQRPGEVLIQTEYPDHPLLTKLLTGGYEAFAEGALQERERSGWPPFARIALLRAEAPTPAAAMQFLHAARDAAQAGGLLACAQDTNQSALRGLRLLGPAPAPMERRAGRFRAQLLLQAPSHGPVQKFLAGWLPILETLPASRQVRWSIDVDAQELF